MTNLKKNEKIFITWHYTTHGIAFLKQVLAEFYKRGLSQNKIDWTGIIQSENEKVFAQSPNGVNGFVFDHVYYLTASQSVFNEVSNRIKYRAEMPEDEVIIETGIKTVWSSLLLSEDIKNPDYLPDLQKDIDFVRCHYPEQYNKFMETLWRDIQHYQIKDQIKWFCEFSTIKDLYHEKFHEYDTGINALRNPQEIIQSVEIFIASIIKNHPDATLYINISLGSAETQVVWHALSQAGILPSDTHFIQTYDSKNQGNDRRFNPFFIKEIPVNLFEKLGSHPIYIKPQSEKRKIADSLMKHFINSGFSILIFGERGVGKSHLARKYNKNNLNFKDINCASFADDTMAESSLFGYEKGAFTGAYEKTNGLFQQAKGGILFLDEIHHLSKRVQEKLMKAIETDENNDFSITRLGGAKPEKIKCTLIFATNRSIPELREKLHEDFFDRIAQNCIYLPSLRESEKDRQEDWKMIWKQMNFGEMEDAPSEKGFIQWLRSLPLYGNFRDLQRIALNYHNFMKFDTELKKLLGFKSAFEFTKSEFEKINFQSLIFHEFSPEKSIAETELQFKSSFANWAISYFGSARKAAEYFQKKGDKTTPETLYRWKNARKDHAD